MAGVLTFHNKFHRANHHTLSGFDIVDSGMDPIASKRYPFLGIFYNKLTDTNRTYNIDTDSYQWWSAFTTVEAYSANWMLTKSVWTTVNRTSGEWNLGYNAYLNLSAFSGYWVSTYNTVCAFSAAWGSPYLMFTNRVQEYTHAKTFSGQTLGLVTISAYDWNLDTQQVAFIKLDRDSFINNPDEETIKNGGIYTLVFQQDNTTIAPTGHEVEFDTVYRFNDRARLNNIVNKTLSGITIINFLAIGNYLYGDVTFLSGNY